MHFFYKLVCHAHVLFLKTEKIKKDYRNSFAFSYEKIIFFGNYSTWFQLSTSPWRRGATTDTWTRSTRRCWAQSRGSPKGPWTSNAWTTRSASKTTPHVDLRVAALAFAALKCEPRLQSLPAGVYVHPHQKPRNVLVLWDCRPIAFLIERCVFEGSEQQQTPDSR